MGYTNKTSHYDLPQWIAGDKPSWLGDVNTAMLNIDTAIAGADASASAAESSAAAANAQVQAQEPKITKNTTDIQALTKNLADTQGEVNNVKTTAEGAATAANSLTPVYAGFDSSVNGVNVYAIKIGGAIFLFGRIYSSTAYTGSTKVAEVAGNPLSLTVGTRNFQIPCNITTPETSSVPEAGCAIKYDGTKTEFYVGGIKANNLYIVSGANLLS